MIRPGTTRRLPPSKFNFAGGGQGGDPALLLLVDDKTPAQPVDQKADQAKLTPEEKVAAKKGKRAKKHKELSQVEKLEIPMRSRMARL